MARITVLDAYRVAIKTLEGLPDKSLVSKTGKRVTIHEVAGVLRTVAHWCYPELSSEDIQKVVRCEKCEHYHHYRRKSEYKSPIVYMCDIDKVRRPPDFFCKDGVEK